MNEIFPKGFNSWKAYYHANEKKEKRNYLIQSIAVMLVFFGAIVLDGLTTTM